MGNIQSSITDHEPVQHSEQGMREMGFPLDQKIPLGGPFFIEGQNPKNGIYEFRIYHLDTTGFLTEFFTFETCHPLRNEFNVVYDGSIIKFVFQTDSFEKGLKHVLEFTFDFSASFQSKKEFSGPLRSMPFLLPSNRKMFFLHGKYWYYLIPVDANLYYFYIVESSDESKRGFESTFKSGDVVIQRINVESSNFPRVMNDEQGNPVIASVDEGFESIPIRLPSDELTLTQALGQETFP
jgi:hypothetical protein